MNDWVLPTLLLLVLAGFAAILLTPREKKRKIQSARNEFEGLDDYGVLHVLIHSGRYRQALKKIRQMIRDEHNLTRRRMLEKIDEEVKNVVE
ncbi:MAG: hypothetical protein RMI43_02630 [Candidatus Caldarchaeum sp.]|nr:hypothetical protein [Candidatus Caldarchaeum sp.]MCS7133522.1 hypothetical protein [Candidatus Caldarchaeum sp.]MCX8201154.1 hypothetical protein [Candidatus Caldarchaeum sp.]MDW8063048.1 hypothetical protein [Candidatus Caldarchaeum sp.]MDW8434717.1 hypothetical protein [Candidatus Caldarchaeum sp.]